MRALHFEDLRLQASRMQELAGQFPRAPDVRRVEVREADRRDANQALQGVADLRHELGDALADASYSGGAVGHGRSLHGEANRPGLQVLVRATATICVMETLPNRAACSICWSRASARLPDTTARTTYRPEDGRPTSRTGPKPGAATMYAHLVA